MTQLTVPGPVQGCYYIIYLIGDDGTRERLIQTIKQFRMYGLFTFIKKAHRGMCESRKALIIWTEHVDEEAAKRDMSALWFLNSLLPCALHDVLQADKFKTYPGRWLSDNTTCHDNKPFDL